jgi:hypothetical protein
VRLRDYNRSGWASGERAKGLGLKARIGGAAAVALALVAGGATLAIKGRAAAVPTDATTLCPTKRPPSEIMVILLDVSDRFSEPQRLQIQNQMARLRDSIPRFGMVEVYTVDRLRRRVTEPVSHLCNPGTGADLNKIYQNPQLAKKKWDGFATKLRVDIDHQIEKPAHQTSPIFEAIQATALRTFGKPEYDGLPKRLVIVSDLLQHVPGGLSMYQGGSAVRFVQEVALLLPGAVRPRGRLGSGLLSGPARGDGAGSEAHRVLGCVFPCPGRRHGAGGEGVWG